MRMLAPSLMLSLLPVAPWTNIRAGGAALLAALAALFAVTVWAPDASAQRGGREEEEERDPNRVFSPDIGEQVQRALELIDTEDYAGAIGILDRALGRRGVNEYEIGVILQIRGNSNYQLDRVRQAIADWDRALAEGNLTPSERLGLMFNIGQLYLVEGEYRTFITKIEEWISLGGDPSDKVHLNLVAAYAELGEYRNALRHARLAYDKADPRERKHYDMLNFLFSELNMPRDRLNLLREMVGVFPREKSVWLTLAAVNAQLDNTRRAFEINKIMYLNGMLEDEGEIMRIVDYFSFYDVPFQGARILEREMNRGRVERNQENYEKLARLYRQAREFGRAVDPLQQAARRSGDGELYKQLGEAFYSRGRLAEAEQAMRQAIEQGGLNRTGDAWSILAAAIYEQDDTIGRYEARDQAIEAYEEALEFDHSRRTAQGWITFIEKEVETFRAREDFENKVRRDEVRVICERHTRDSLLAGGFGSEIDGEETASVPVPRNFADDPRFAGVDCFQLVENPDRYFAELEAARAAAAEPAVDGEAGEGVDDATAAGDVQEG